MFNSVIDRANETDLKSVLRQRLLVMDVSFRVTSESCFFFFSFFFSFFFLFAIGTDGTYLQKLSKFIES